MALNQTDRDTLLRIERKQDDAQLLLGKLPCELNCFKISLLQKVVYGAITLILVAFMVTILNTPATNKNYNKRVEIKKPDVPELEVNYIIDYIVI